MPDVLIDIGYNWLTSAWQVSTVLIFLILAAEALLSYYKEELSLETYKKSIIGHSRLSVGIIFLLGILTNITSLANYLPEEFILGEVLALSYFAYLFYHY